MGSHLTKEDVLGAIRKLVAAGNESVSSSDVIDTLNRSSSTVRRHLDLLYAAGKLSRDGKARATRYRLVELRGTSSSLLSPAPAGAASSSQIIWSLASIALGHKLDQPLAARTPVTYQRDFVDSYEPNKTHLLPQALADELFQTGRLQGRQPAGTYARKVLEQLLIDLSWSSSRLEGNRYTLLDTQKLFEQKTAATDTDSVMLLNHKEAIEFLVDAVPSYNLSEVVVRNLHAVLMQSLLANSDALGSIREQVVNISDTTYMPAQMPALLGEMLKSVIHKAGNIKNPIEATFFLWINLAYLQPFEDGNKRVSRLAANIPLMLYNCAPLSFLDVDVLEYARAMLGVYEFLDVSIAADLFAWTYRRSMKRYAVVMESMGAPDPLRVRYRQHLTDAIGLVVRERKPVQEVLTELNLKEEGAPGFEAMLRDELQKLEAFNFARYRLTLPKTEAWIAAGRPV